ncbi:MAG TPA: hypothetical protein VGS41_00840, partial [Chthonomonadales bacterium]|nr:hypothetical protein [Chthonomonadales bacterium]
PVYRGSPRERALYSDKGLDVLAASLESLEKAGEDFPMVAPYLDTTSVAEEFGERPDLRTAAAQSALYRMVHDFYLRIPDRFRYTAAYPPANGGRRAYPIFLSDAAAFSDVDSTFVSYLRSRFSADFDGADLIILGASNFKPKATLDGYFTETGAKGFQFEGDGWIKTASVGAGYDATFISRSATAQPIIRPNGGEDAYRSDWKSALNSAANWVLIDGWNDYGTGSAVAPTMEAGFSLADITREYSRLFAGDTPLGSKLLWADVPPVLAAGTASQARVRIQNTGIEGWSGAPSAGLTQLSIVCRWMRDGKEVARSRPAPLDRQTLAGADITQQVPLSAADRSGAPLPAAVYLLEIDAEAGPGKSAQRRKLMPLVTSPVTVTAGEAAGPPVHAEVVDTDLRPLLESGSVYDVHATIRNDGAAAWKKSAGVRIGLRLYRYSDTTGKSSLTLVPAADAGVALPQDVAPGAEVTVRLLFPLTTPAGKPLPVWRQSDPWCYVVRWEVNQKGEGVSFNATPLDVCGYDFGVRFTADATPDSLPALRRQPVRLSLRNDGPQTWRKDQVRIGYHWYYADGSEYLWEDETTPIPQDVAPGDSVDDILAWVTAPPDDGEYWLVWDVKFGDSWASESGCTNAFDETVHHIQVIAGKLKFADLTKAYNVDGVT